MRVLAFLLLAATAGWGQTCVPTTIDDFKTGQTTSPIVLQTPNTSAIAFQNASGVPGRVREESYSVTTNDFNHPSELAIVRPNSNPNGGALVVSNGVEEFFSLVLIYGTDTRGNPVPLGFQVPANCDRFRVWFDSSVATLSFTFEAYTRNANGSTTGFADGIGMPPVIAGFPGCVDFPFSNFVTNASGVVQNIAHTPVDQIILVLGPGSAVGGSNFAMTKIEVSDNRLPPTGVPCIIANNGK
ncbi:MAG TPA: hypothetical protein VF532_14445 [Candidatus Angelobacter sp.]